MRKAMEQYLADLHIHSLIAIALILFFITIFVNGAARLLIYKTSFKGARK